MAVSREAFEREFTFPDQIGLVDSVMIVSGLRLNFVNLGEHEEGKQEAWLKPIVLPTLTNKINGIELCVQNFYPVLISHKVKLKSRPSGFLTPSSSLKFVSLSYQTRIVTKLFSSSFISKQRESAVPHKRKGRTLELERKRLKVMSDSEHRSNDLTESLSRVNSANIVPLTGPMLAKIPVSRPDVVDLSAQPDAINLPSPKLNSITGPIGSTRGNGYLPSSENVGIVSVIENVRTTGPTKNPIFSRNSAALKLSTGQVDSKVKNGSLDLKTVTARRKPVHSMPDFKFRRIPIRKTEVKVSERAYTKKNQRPVVLPAYSMISSSEEEDSDCEVATSITAAEKFKETNEHPFEESSTDLFPVCASQDAAGICGPEFEHSTEQNATFSDKDYTSELKHSPINEVRLFEEPEISLFNTLQSQNILNTGTRQDFTPTNPTGGTRQSLSFNSFTSFISEAKMLPEKLLSRFWHSPIGSQSQAAEGDTTELDDTEEIFLEDANCSTNNNSNSLSQFLAKVHKRRD